MAVFFSKDAILGGVLEHGGPLYMGLFVLGLLTALLTSFYTFRMLFVVFHGAPTPPFEKGGLGEISSAAIQIPPDPPLLKGEEQLNLPSVMTLTLIPLALFGLLGGCLNLPEYLASHGLLTDFLGTVSGFAPLGQVSSDNEISQQIMAATACIIGLGLAWSRYTGDRRAASLTTESGPAPFAIRFLQAGWMLDDLYRLLFIRPFVWLARFFWKGIDEATIDGTLDGLARLTARMGRLPASWSTGRVATSLIAIAGGVTLVLVYLAICFLHG